MRTVEDAYKEIDDAYDCIGTALYEDLPLSTFSLTDTE